MTYYLVLKCSSSLKNLRREVIKDDPCPDRPRTSKTDGNVEKIREIVRKNRCLRIRAITESVNIDKETVRKIL